jgi:16S rRNA (guanine1207-N2)-methyltransferase/23S rRNA (guanine1835-N2)-methyltransferase
MNTNFQFLDKTLQLYRYPKRFMHPSWQAWDAADELILAHVAEQCPEYVNHHFLILNDDFGALTTWLSPARITHISDSLVAQKACQKNLQLNQVASQQVEYLDSLSPLPQAPNWVLIKIPKTTALLEYQLVQLQAVIAPHTRIVAAAKAKSIQKSTLALFEKYLGKTHTSLAKKKSRLVFCEALLPLKVDTLPPPLKWTSDDGHMEIINFANVFARQQMDIGARLLAAHLPDCESKRVVDLGCGNGVIGLTVLQRTQLAKVTFIDESYMAVANARENVQLNFPERLSDCEFIVSNCLEEVDNQAQFDIVLCNPPFHQQNTITDHIAYQMFDDSKAKLARGGELRIIGNRHLDYPQTLKRLFGGYQVISSDRKFSILSAKK